MLFIVSRTTLVPASESTADADRLGESQVEVSVARVDGTKCVRCWRYVPEVATLEAYAGLCSRCVDAVREPAPMSRS
jgi:isoleucyl-tRNA synthetase